MSKFVYRKQKRIEFDKRREHIDKNTATRKEIWYEETACRVANKQTLATHNCECEPYAVEDHCHRNGLQTTWECNKTKSYLNKIQHNF